MEDRDRLERRMDRLYEVQTKEIAEMLRKQTILFTNILKEELDASETRMKAYIENGVGMDIRTLSEGLPALKKQDMVPEDNTD